MKTFFFLYIFLFTGGVVFADSGVGTVSWTSSSGNTGCSNSISHSLTHRGVPTTNNTSAAQSGNTGCTTHLYYLGDDIVYPSTGRYNKGQIRACPAKMRAISIQKYNGGLPVSSGNWDQYTLTCRSWDDTPPTTVGYNLAGGTTMNNTWTNQNVTSSASCVDVGTNGSSVMGSGCSGIQYRRESASFACNSGGTWVNGSSFNHTVSAGAQRIDYICFRARDVAGNNYTYSGVATIKIDKRIPTAGDINSLNLTQTGYLASNARNVSFNVSSSGGSPIVRIQGRFENAASPENTYSWVNINNASFSHAWNMRLVDNDATPNDGVRNYNFQITYIEDDAGNSLGTLNSTATIIQNHSYNIFADTSSFTAKRILSHPFGSPIIADASVKNITLSLFDQYGNKIIPQASIGRNISFDVQTNNSTFLNQYAQTGSSFYVNGTGGVNQIAHGNNVWKTIGNMTPNVSNAIYTFPFYIYAPNNDTTGFLSSNLQINALRFSITGAGYGPRTNVSVDDHSTTPLYPTQIRARPLFTINMTGDIPNSGFIEGAQQNSRLVVTKQNTTVISQDDIRAEYGVVNAGNNNIASAKFNLLSQPSGNAFAEGNQSNISTTTNVGNLTTQNISTLLQQQSIVNETETGYFATIVKYDVAGKTVIYPHYIFGKTSYFGTVNSGNTFQKGAKILGTTNSEKSEEIVMNQFTSDVRLLGDFTKASLRKSIYQNISEALRGISLPDNAGSLNDLGGTSGWKTSVTEGTNLKNGAAKYFLMNGGNITISGNVTGNKTLVVEGGNIYINGNIRGNGMLGLIALTKNNQGGNIYISPSVTDIHAVMYADKSLMSFDGTNELSGDTLASILANQLYILGSVFSENTLGASRKSTPVCPYFESASCDTILAQKYDMNYLRRHFTDISGNPSGTESYGNTATQGSRTELVGYPLIVEYNPDIKTNPPVFLNISK